MPAAMIAVPSPNGKWKATPSARRFSNARIPSAVSTSAASTNVNCPKVEMIKRMDPTAATRCSGPSTRHAGGRLRTKLELLAPRESSIGLVPVRDLVFALFPAEVDLLPVAQRGEVDQTPLQVAHDNLDSVKLTGSRLQLEKRLGHVLAGLAAAVAGRRLAERFAHVLIGEVVARGAQTLDAL